MNNKFLNYIIKVADFLDKRNLSEEANILDELVSVIGKKINNGSEEENRSGG